MWCFCVCPQERRRDRRLERLRHLLALFFRVFVVDDGSEVVVLACGKHTDILSSRNTYCSNHKSGKFSFKLELDGVPARAEQPCATQCKMVGASVLSSILFLLKSTRSHSNDTNQAKPAHDTVGVKLPMISH